MKFGIIAVGLLVASSGAFASTPGNVSGQSELANAQETRNYPGTEMIGLKPELGAVNFINTRGDRSTRAAVGAAIDFNAAALVGLNPAEWTTGATTGFSYSHIGNVGADNLNQGGANLWMIPVNAKANYRVISWLRTGVHGGGNVMYRSQANAVKLGNEANGAKSQWSFYPNAGLDFDFDFSRNVELSFRPDWTFTTNNSFASAFLSLGIRL